MGILGEGSLGAENTKSGDDVQDGQHTDEVPETQGGNVQTQKQREWTGKQHS
jgi:hypothetical protein